MPINEAMLRLARQRKGFQQGEAAELLGVAQATLSRAENGLIEPTDDIIDRIVSIYDIPRSFFSQPDPIYGAPVSVHPMWRRKADVTLRDMDKIVAELNIRLMHIRRLLEAAEVNEGFGIPRLDAEEYGDPEKIAGIVRAHWRVPSGPIKDLTKLVEGAGAIVVHSALGGAAVSGVTFAVPGLPPLIVLNEEQPADRLRFTLAHELGHLVMHRFPTSMMEDEANVFAGALLMPASDIRPYFVGRKIDFALLAALKPEWKVAMQSLLMRARSLKVVSPNQERYLWQQFSMRRMRLREPPELDFLPEKPSTAHDLIRLYLEELGYGLDELAALLHIHPYELRSLYRFNVDGGERGTPRFRIVR